MSVVGAVVSAVVAVVAVVGADGSYGVVGGFVDPLETAQSVPFLAGE